MEIKRYVVWKNKNITDLNHALDLIGISKEEYFKKHPIEFLNSQDDLFDIVEELVMISSMNKDLPLILDKEYLTKDKFKTMVKAFQPDTKVYGAMWNEQGLKYVAIANREGELSLLWQKHIN